ncbi:MAG: conserved rane protein of unknown function [Chloroflexi bacterium]|nr:conserved rane protein of unknown function [Chloroflexota bacterium]
MSSSLPDARVTARPGLIDTLQAGFNTVNRNAWLLLLPLAIDIFLWLGPQVSMGGALDSWLRAAVPPPGSDSSLVQIFEQNRRSSLETLQQGDGISRFNLLSLIAMPILGIPSFRFGLPGEGTLLPAGSLGSAAAVSAGVLIAGLIATAMFYGLMAQAVRDGGARPRTFIDDAGRLCVAVAGLYGLIIVLTIAIGVPLYFLLVVASAAAPPAAAIVGPLFVGFLLWGLLYLFFTTEALFIGRVSPILAMQQSIVVVRGYFWPTLGFIALYLVISIGMATLWQEIARNLRGVGTIVAIVGHIYISSGLAAASMTYYRERSEQLRSHA